MKAILLLLFAEVLCGQFFQRSYAIVIGIHVYETGEGLPNARNDARSIAAVLKSQGYEVTELYDGKAKRAAIIDALDNVALKATEHDRVVFFFAGHGTTLTRGGKDWGYIVPYDARTQQNTVQESRRTFVASSLIPMNELQAQSERMGNAKHQLFLMDSCYGGGIGVRDIPGGVSPNAPNYLAEITKRVARQALTAGGRDQTVEDGANGHSIFTEVLLEALQEGKADVDGDGIITFPELSAYVLSRATTSKQTPGQTLLPGHGLGEYWFVSPTGAHAMIGRNRQGVGLSRGDGETNEQRGDYWVDPITLLMWTRKDNLADIDQPDALRYCADLRLSGFSDWRLARITELETLYDPNIVSGTLNRVHLHVKGNIRLSAPNAWASEHLEEAGGKFNFVHGHPVVSLVTVANASRALCTRFGGPTIRISRLFLSRKREATVEVLNVSDENLHSCSVHLATFHAELDPPPSTMGMSEAATSQPFEIKDGLIVGAPKPVDLKPHERYQWPDFRISTPSADGLDWLDPNHYLVQTQVSCFYFDPVGREHRVESKQLDHYHPDAQ